MQGPYSCCRGTSRARQRARTGDQHAIHHLRRLIKRDPTTPQAKLAIDDFGSGYSSLQYIRELPVSYLKIDAGFIKNLKKDTGDTMIVDAVCKLGHSFDLQVIAEGVETEEGGRIATELGCDLLQGYQLAKPMESELISSFFDK